MARPSGLELHRCYGIGLASFYAALSAGCREAILELYSPDLGPHTVSGRFTLSPLPLPSRAKRLFSKTGAFWVFCSETDAIRSRWMSSGLGVVEARPEQLSLIGVRGCRAYYAPDDYLAPPSLAFARATAITTDRRSAANYGVTIENTPCRAHVAIAEFREPLTKPMIVLNSDQSFVVVPVRKGSRRAYIYSVRSEIVDGIDASLLLTFSIKPLNNEGGCRQCRARLRREGDGRLIITASNCDTATLANLVLEAVGNIREEELRDVERSVDYLAPLPWSLLG